MYYRKRTSSLVVKLFWPCTYKYPDGSRNSHQRDTTNPHVNPIPTPMDQVPLLHSTNGHAYTRTITLASVSFRDSEKGRSSAGTSLYLGSFPGQFALRRRSEL